MITQPLLLSSTNPHQNPLHSQSIFFTPNLQFCGLSHQMEAKEVRISSKDHLFHTTLLTLIMFFVWKNMCFVWKYISETSMNISRDASQEVVSVHFSILISVVVLINCYLVIIFIRYDASWCFLNKLFLQISKVLLWRL